MIRGIRECGLTILIIFVYLQDNLDELAVVAFALWQSRRFARFVIQRITSKDKEKIVNRDQVMPTPAMSIDEKPIAKESKIQQAIREAREAQEKRVLQRISSMTLVR